MPTNFLIADDSAVTRAVMQRILRLSGLDVGEVHEAKNGMQAMEILADYPVDVVLLDINMPVMNGEECLEMIRRTPGLAGLPVVVISTEGSETRIEHFRSLKAGFIHKPFLPERVRDVVREITGGRS